MSIVVNAGATAHGFDWAALIVPATTLLGVIIAVVVGLKTTRLTLRANILSTFRCNWLEAFREELSELLALGERLYEERLEPEDETTKKEVHIELAAHAQALIVLLGRGSSNRMALAEEIRAFSISPSKEVAEEIEVQAQDIFRSQWDMVRNETGEKSIEVRTLPRTGMRRQSIEGEQASESPE